MLKFGTRPVTAPTIDTIPGSIITGAVCGLLGAGFIIVNTYLGLFRKHYITKPWMKIVEAVLFSTVTTTCFYWSPWFANDCTSLADIRTNNPANLDLVVNYDCPTDEYSPLATMFFNTEGDAIRTIISRFEGPGGILVDWQHMLIYFIWWYFFMSTTYGTWIPAGLFLPGIIIGCAVGSIY